MNRWFYILLFAGLCLALSALGCDRGGGQIASEIILRSPLANSEWPVSIQTGVLVIDGTYLVNGAPAPAGTEIAVSVFLWWENGGVSSRFFDPDYLISGDDGKFYIEIQPWGWPSGQYTVQIVDGDYLYESPEFKMTKTEIILRSPLPESTWDVGEKLVIDGTYLIDGTPVPKGKQIGIAVFQYPDDNSIAAIRGGGFAIIGDDGNFYLEIEIDNWQADRYMVQCTTEDGLLYYESPRFNIVGESH